MNISSHMRRLMAMAGIISLPVVVFLFFYIAKKIIEAHGGTIWVQSQPDKGSTFGVSLPV